MDLKKIRYLFSTGSGILCQGTLFAIHGRLTVAVHGDRHPCHRTPDPAPKTELNSYKISNYSSHVLRGIGIPTTRASSRLDGEFRAAMDGFKASLGTVIPSSGYTVTAI